MPADPAHDVPVIRVEALPRGPSDTDARPVVRLTVDGREVHRDRLDVHAAGERERFVAAVLEVVPAVDVDRLDELIALLADPPRTTGVAGLAGDKGPDGGGRAVVRPADLPGFPSTRCRRRAPTSSGPGPPRRGSTPRSSACRCWSPAPG